MATILVVDDEPDILDLVQIVLEDLGYTVLTASDGKEALQACRMHADPINALITDLLMPVMDGRKLAESLAGLFPQVKVIYMSGEPRQSLVNQGKLPPDAVIIEKPFNLSDMENTVRQALEEK